MGFFGQLSLAKILERPLAYKGEVQAIIDYLKSNEIDCFYHCTDRSNIDSICKYGLLSFNACLRFNISPKTGGNSRSHMIDKQFNLDDFVRLSFISNLPMMERLRAEGRDLVLFKIDLKVAGLLQTFFTDRNAIDPEHILGSTLAFLKRINEPQGFYDPYKLQQAEVLVRTHVPKEFILNLDNPISFR